MLKILSGILVLLVVFMSVPCMANTEETALDNEGNILIDRGIVGVVYKGVETVLRGVGYVVLGRFGLKGLTDYFRLDKIFHDKKPLY